MMASNSTMKSALNGGCFLNSKRGRNRGFSIVELLIAITIGMVLLGFAIPVLQNAMRNYSLNSAASNVSRIVQLARYTAIRQGSDACTVLDGTIFGIDADCDGARDANQQSYALPSGISLDSAGPDPVGMNYSTAPTPVDPPFVMTFNSRGSTAVAPTASLVYLAGWGNSAAVTISGAGRARNWRYTGDTWY